MKLIKNLIKNLPLSNTARSFYAVVRCLECGEEIRVRVRYSSDFQIAYDAQNSDHCYTIKKEIIGKDCYNLMKLTLAVTKNAKVLFADTKACSFIKLDRE